MPMFHIWSYELKRTVIADDKESACNQVFNSIVKMDKPPLLSEIVVVSESPDWENDPTTHVFFTGRLIAEFGMHDRYVSCRDD